MKASTMHMFCVIFKNFQAILSMHLLLFLELMAWAGQEMGKQALGTSETSVDRL